MVRDRQGLVLGACGEVDGSGTLEGTQDPLQLQCSWVCVGGVGGHSWGGKEGVGQRTPVLGGEGGGYLGEEKENTPRGEEDILEEESKTPRVLTHLGVPALLSSATSCHPPRTHSVLWPH